MIRRLWHRHTFTRWTDPATGLRWETCPCGKSKPWFQSGHGTVAPAHESMKATKQNVEPFGKRAAK